MFIVQYSIPADTFDFEFPIHAILILSVPVSKTARISFCSALRLITVARNETRTFYINPT